MPESAGGSAGQTEPAGRTNGRGVQVWPDGCRYEGQFVEGLKQGIGVFTWPNGEVYEGSFYRDCRHGEGVFSWPGGARFVGKFYLNQREGYGIQEFPNGTVFQGLYHSGQRFGPGVATYPDGRQDVGLWHQDRLIRLYRHLPGGVTLSDFPGHVALLGGGVAALDSAVPRHGGRELPCADPALPSGQMLGDTRFVLPPGLLGYSVDSDHLPLLRCLRAELNRLFFGGRGGEPDDDPTLPLEQRIQEHVHRHRFEAVAQDWDVAAVLAGAREQFSTKGPREESAEHLIVGAAQGDCQSVSRALRDAVHPDVADARGHTAILAAAVNCHRDVIHMLLDSGADVNKLSDEGVSALASCLLLYYPVHTLTETLAERPPNRGPSPALMEDFPDSDGSSFTFEGKVMGAATISQSEPEKCVPTTGGSSKIDHTGEMDHIKDFRGTGRYEINHVDAVSTGSEIDCENVVDLGSDVDRVNAVNHDNTVDPGSKIDCENVVDLGSNFDPDNAVDPGSNIDRDKEIDPGSKIDCENVVDLGSNFDPDNAVDLGSNIDRDNEVDPGRNVNPDNVIDLSDQVDHDIGADCSGKIHLRDVTEPSGEVTLHEHVNLKHGPTPAAPCWSNGQVGRSIRVLDGNVSVGSVPWARATGMEGGSETDDDDFESMQSMASFHVHVTEEAFQKTAEGLSHADLGNAEETVWRMARMKMEHRELWATIELLLARGADPNACRVPVPALFLAIKAGHVQGVRRLLEGGARTDIPLPPERKGLYPLHVAAGLPGPEGPQIMELLLATAADPDVRAQDVDEVFELDDVAGRPGSSPSLVAPQSARGSHSGSRSNMARSSGPSPQGCILLRDPPEEGGRTALHIACQRDTDHAHTRDVVRILLAHRANTDLLWSGHSPLSLAIASGNDLAVDELLSGGADPNLPLARQLGSALCAVANIVYDSERPRRHKSGLLEKLVRAGADILMPVEVNVGRSSAMGTAVDYAHYSYQQDRRLTCTPYHALTLSERKLYDSRCQLLDQMGDVMRQTTVWMERQRLEEEQRQGVCSVSPVQKFLYIGAGAKPSQVSQGEVIPAGSPIPGSRAQTKTYIRKPLFSYCYQCGRSVGVTLKACSRCQEVSYCSEACKVKSWGNRHREECVRLTGRVKNRSSTQDKSRIAHAVLGKKSPSDPPRSLPLTANYSFI
ncbi:ankyrin repeat and MYND domain-containing protein 1 [Brienomyrus brachyistius]|uniref:ankyrin repeat and MYND domain-containing protein 1 n=1 Tax=Brienomyrus brachyistius TaxID=42636 RepID=UPI0020B2A2D8|nr:ankyrin repeat and MYND domain-containing protein 1 [Brienomyrus brachyistius]